MIKKAADLWSNTVDNVRYFHNLGVLVSQSLKKSENSLMIIVEMAVRKATRIIAVSIHIKPVILKEHEISPLNDLVFLTSLSGRCRIPENVLRSFNISRRLCNIQSRVSAAASEPRTQEICANSRQELQIDGR